MARRAGRGGSALPYPPRAHVLQQRIGRLTGHQQPVAGLVVLDCDHRLGPQQAVDRAGLETQDGQGPLDIRDQRRIHGLQLERLRGRRRDLLLLQLLLHHHPLALHLLFHLLALAFQRQAFLLGPQARRFGFLLLALLQLALLLLALVLSGPAGEEPDARADRRAFRCTRAAARDPADARTQQAGAHGAPERIGACGPGHQDQRRDGDDRQAVSYRSNHRSNPLAFALR